MHGVSDLLADHLRLTVQADTSHSNMQHGQRDHPSSLDWPPGHFTGCTVQVPEGFVFDNMFYDWIFSERVRTTLHSGSSLNSRHLDASHYMLVRLVDATSNGYLSTSGATAHIQGTDGVRTNDGFELRRRPQPLLWKAKVVMGHGHRSKGLVSHNNMRGSLARSSQNMLICS
jgi:hypothetical protein